MTEAAPNEEPDSLQEVKNLFTSAYGEHATHQSMDEVLAAMIDIDAIIRKYTPYLAGMYHSDKQRSKAVEYIVKLRKQWRKLSERYDNSLNMLEEVHYPLSVTT